MDAQVEVVEGHCECQKGRKAHITIKLRRDGIAISDPIVGAKRNDGGVQTGTAGQLDEAFRKKRHFGRREGC